MECQAAFARGRREGRLTRGQASAATKSLDERWADLVVVELDARLTRRAGRMVHDQALRALDAIHLASAIVLADSAPSQTTFACWDARLWDAASRQGFEMTPRARPR